MLTARQQRFVEAYLAKPIGAQAAIRAGYSAKTARIIASENLRKPAIAAAIAKGKKKRQVREQVLIEKVREELWNIGVSSMPDIFDEHGKLIDPSLWPNHLKGVINYSKWERVTTRNGETKRVVTKIRVMLPRKLKALEMLGESLGMFPPRKR